MAPISQYLDNQLQTQKPIYLLLLQLKRYWFIAALAMLASLVSITYFIFTKPKMPPPQTLPSPIQEPQKESLLLISINPPPPTFESIWSVEPIILNFNQPLNPQTIKYQIQPTTTVRVVIDDNNPNRFSLLPLSGWNENQPYSVIISSQLSSTTGNQLDKDITFTFTRLVPKTISHPEEENL